MGMPLTLAEIIGSIEDDNKDWPPRFESGLYLKTSAFRHDTGALRPTVQVLRQYNGGVARCSLDTAEALYAMSWGTYQILGMTLYSPPVGYAKSILDFLNSPAEQIACFQKDVSGRRIDFTVDELRDDEAKRRLFAAHYNGDVSGAYADKIAATIARFSPPPAAAALPAA